MEELKSLVNKNRFAGFTKGQKDLGHKINPVHEIVNQFYILKSMDNAPKTAYTGRYAYPKLAREGKRLLESCDGVLDDALWCLDKMNYKATRGGYDWSISTCLKHDLGYGTL